MVAAECLGALPRGDWTVSGVTSQQSDLAEYFYPDRNDDITTTMINALSDFQRWTDQEQRVILALAQRILELPTPRRMLDLGAGLGRLAVQLAPYCERGRLVEPDDHRRAGLTKGCRAIGLPASRFGVAGHWPDGDVDDQYDVVLVSHVFQHVTETTVMSILTDVSAHLRPGGLLYVATCFEGAAEESYTLNRFDARRTWEEAAIDRDTFERLAGASAAGQLPVHFFTRERLVSMIEGNGFTVTDVLPFHALFDASGEPAGFRDVAVIAERRLEGGR